MHQVAHAYLQCFLKPLGKLDAIELATGNPSYGGDSGAQGATLIEQIQYIESYLLDSDTPVSIATELTAATELNTSDISTTIYGTFGTTDESIPLPNVTVGLQKDVGGTWTDVTTAVTDANGDYEFNDYESVIGNYDFRTTFAGDAFFNAATSGSVPVDVAALIYLTNMAYPT
jgi:5-hydroxyisourate hydrolase-like protein (transthyretin family)